MDFLPKAVTIFTCLISMLSPTIIFCYFACLISFPFLWRNPPPSPAVSLLCIIEESRQLGVMDFSPFGLNVMSIDFTALSCLHFINCVLRGAEGLLIVHLLCSIINHVYPLVSC